MLEPHLPSEARNRSYPHLRLTQTFTDILQTAFLEKRHRAEASESAKAPLQCAATNSGNLNDIVQPDGVPEVIENETLGAHNIVRCWRKNATGDPVAVIVRQ